MSLFGFGNIVFDKSNGDRTKGPLAALEKNQFEKTRLRYPIDLGQTDKAHYLVFYIREQTRTKFGSGAGGAANKNALEDATKSQVAAGKAQIMGSIQKAKDAVNQAKSGFASDVLDKLNGISSQGGIAGALSKVAGNVVGGINNVFGSTSVTFGGNSQATEDQIQTSIKKITGQNLEFLRTTRLTKDSIALYMPDTLQYGYSQTYDQLSLGGELGGQALAAGKSALEEYEKTGKIGDAFGSVLKSAGNVAGQKGVKKLGELTGNQQTAQAILASTGRVENPMLEMVYKSPAFRDFQFDFTFYPRDEREALEVQKIIKKFTFHQAPEVLSGTGGFLVPPSEFDIQFYYNGAQNPNIPTVGTCILKGIQVNYAPNGFTAYEIPGENAPALGRTGMPVAIQITLQFQEVVIITKKDLTDDSPSPSKPDKQSGPYPNDATITGRESAFF
jgi:hypothetical protein